MASISPSGGPRICWPDSAAAGAMVCGEAGARPCGLGWDGSQPMASKYRSRPAGVHTRSTSLGEVIRSVSGISRGRNATLAAVTVVVPSERTVRSRP